LIPITLFFEIRQEKEEKEAKEANSAPESLPKKPHKAKHLELDSR